MGNWKKKLDDFIGYPRDMESMLLINKHDGIVLDEKPIEYPMPGIYEWELSSMSQDEYKRICSLADSDNVAVVAGKSWRRYYTFEELTPSIQNYVLADIQKSNDDACEIEGLKHKVFSRGELLSKAIRGAYFPNGELLRLFS